MLITDIQGRTDVTISVYTGTRVCSTLQELLDKLFSEKQILSQDEYDDEQDDAIKNKQLTLYESSQEFRSLCHGTGLGTRTYDDEFYYLYG